ncbi:MAG: tyrosine--tRNA ligase [Parcubacteria group bacterium]|jgi:tyrosyl-tRNA synthetase|nr:tyrosine--tRNA ligase [Parcubacteria group bacterium]
MNNMDPLKNLQDRGFVKNCSNESALREKITKEPITFYVGFDATADSLHVGHLMPIMAVAHLQKAGHIPILVVGGGTTLIGDPSGRTEMRKMLSLETIMHNAEQVQKQLSKFISFEDQKGMFQNNLEWLADLKYIEFLRDVGKYFRVNEMIKSEAYRLRLERQDGLSFIEFNYQLLQAYDFLMLNDKYGCVLQIGGDDQWGNIVAGVSLIRQMRQKEVYALTFPLLETASGKKMGKTEAGAVWFDALKTSPFEYYQYWINTDDRDVIKFLKFFTFLSLDEIAEMEKLTGADIRQAKETLAFEATKIAHGEEEAKKAMEASRSLFGSDVKDHENIPSKQVEKKLFEKGISVVDLFCIAGLATSKTASRKLIEQGGAYIENERVTSAEKIITEKDLVDNSILLRQGKKNYIKVVLK